MVHQYKSNGYNMLLDVCSGSVHVVDDLVYDIVEILNNTIKNDYADIKSDNFNTRDNNTNDNNKNDNNTNDNNKNDNNTNDNNKNDNNLNDNNTSDNNSSDDNTSDSKSIMNRIDNLDFIIAELNNGYDNYLEEDIKDAVSDIKELTELGQLFTDDTYKSAIIDFKKRQTVVKALCLHIAHDCNLKCKYCFAEEGEYKGKRALMTLEVGKKAIDFLVANSGNRYNLEVDFFGGEPLMNFEVVKEIVKYGRSLEKEHNKNFRFTLTTNGVLLDEEVIEFANKEISNVVLSTDGRKEVHDKMRPTPNAKGSYDIVMPKFKEFLDKRGNLSYYARGTFTHHNLDFCEDVIHLADLGYDQISVEPVVSAPSMEYAITEEDLPRIYEEYDRLALELIKRHKEGKPINFFHFMIDLSGGPCVYKRLSGCGSGTEYLAVTPWGDLYPCHQFVGIDEFLMGNVYEGIEKTEIVNDFKLCNVYAKDKCKECFARFYCSGGCAANSYQFHGSILDAYDIGCALQKKRVECALMIKAALADNVEGEE